MNSYLMAAGAMSFLTFAVHTFIGGPRIVPLLDDSDIPHVAKNILYGCWHFATITIALMGAGFVWAAIDPGAVEVAWFCLALSISFALWSGWLTAARNLQFFRRPQWALFLSVSIFGLAGLL